MKMQEEIESLKIYCERAEKELISDAYSMRYERQKKVIGAVLSSMSWDHIGIGTYLYLRDGNISLLKQHYHVAGKLNIASAGLPWGEDLEIGGRALHVMLSDSPVVINAYANLEPTEYLKHRDNPNLLRFQVHMYQLAIRDELDALSKKIEIAAQKASKKLREKFSEGSDFYSLFLKRDKKELEALILQSAKQWETSLKRGQKDTPITGNIMATVAMRYAKLCWLKGIEVEVDHPLVPMELLSIKPLDHYDDVYDFLQPDWTPPPQNVLQKIGGWFSKK